MNMNMVELCKQLIKKNRRAIEGNKSLVSQNVTSVFGPTNANHVYFHVCQGRLATQHVVTHPPNLRLPPPNVLKHTTHQGKASTDPSNPLSTVHRGPVWCSIPEVPMLSITSCKRHQVQGKRIKVFKSFKNNDL